MNKELKALERIKEFYPQWRLSNRKDFNLIETTLKDYDFLKERTKLDSFECLLRLEEILPRGKELLIPVAKELKRKQDLEQMLHKMNVKHGYEEYLKISKALEIIKEKKVNIGSFLKCCSNLDYEEYVRQWGNWSKDILYNLSKELLTKEEFDLLKEELLCQ